MLREQLPAALVGQASGLIGNDDLGDEETESNDDVGVGIETEEEVDEDDDEEELTLQTVTGKQFF